MSLEVSERDKPKTTKVKAVRFEADVVGLVERYKQFLVQDKGADPKAFSFDRLVNELLREACKRDTELRTWQAKNGNGSVEATR